MTSHRRCCCAEDVDCFWWLATKCATDPFSHTPDNIYILCELFPSPGSPGYTTNWENDLFFKYQNLSCYSLPTNATQVPFADLPYPNATETMITTQSEFDSDLVWTDNGNWFDSCTDATGNFGCIDQIATSCPPHCLDWTFGDHPSDLGLLTVNSMDIPCWRESLEGLGYLCAEACGENYYLPNYFLQRVEFDDGTCGLKSHYIYDSSPVNVCYGSLFTEECSTQYDYCTRCIIPAIKYHDGQPGILLYCAVDPNTFVPYWYITITIESYMLPTDESPPEEPLYTTFYYRRPRYAGEHQPIAGEYPYYGYSATCIVDPTPDDPEEVLRPSSSAAILTLYEY